MYHAPIPFVKFSKSPRRFRLRMVTPTALEMSAWQPYVRSSNLADWLGRETPRQYQGLCPGRFVTRIPALHSDSGLQGLEAWMAAHFVHQQWIAQRALHQRA
jgi:hypothetical protein